MMMRPLVQAHQQRRIVGDTRAAASASSTSGARERSSSAAHERQRRAGARGRGPGPHGDDVGAQRPAPSTAALLHVTPPPSSASALGHVLRRRATATIGTAPTPGVATVTRPGAGAQRGACRRDAAAPVLPARARHHDDAAEVALVRVGRTRGGDGACALLRASAARGAGPRRPSMTSPGMPMSAMTTSPACVSPGGSTSGSFGAASGHRHRRRAVAGRSARRVGRQAARQVDRHHRDARRR